MEIETAPPKSNPAELTHKFSSALVDKEMSRFTKDDWTQAGNLAYNLAAGHSISTNGAPNAFAMINHCGGFSDMKERMATASTPELKTMFQRLAGGFIADQVLIGQLALSYIATSTAGGSVDIFERAAAIKSKSEESAIKAMGFIDRLRSPPSLSITTGQLNLGAVQQVVNANVNPT